MARGSGDWRYVTAGAAAAVILPGLVFGLGAPLWAGLVSAAAAFGGLLLVTPSGRTAEDSGGRAAIVRAAVAEAEPALDTLESAAKRIRETTVARRAAAIAQAGHACIAELEAAPESLGAVQRLLTYYIPRAAELADGYADMEARGLG